MVELVNIWLVVLTFEDNRPEVKWFINEQDADVAVENCEHGEPIVQMVETYKGSNIHKKAK